MASPFLDPKAIDRAPVDAFTPFLFMGGMISRAAGEDAERTLYMATLVEVLVNATARHFKPYAGSTFRQEHPANMLTDIAAGLGGWLVMDWIIRRSA